MRAEIADLRSDRPAGCPSWLLTLIAGLPDTSAFQASRRGGPEYRGWGEDRVLSKLLFDAVQVNTVVTAKVAGNKRVKYPDPYPMPGQASKKKAGKRLSALRPRMPKRRAVSSEPTRPDLEAG